MTAAHLSMASLTIDYLNMAGFKDDTSVADIESLVPTGFYGFMDYSVTSWLRHMEKGVDGKEKEEIVELAESLEAFLDIHFVLPGSATERKLPPLSKANERRLKIFEDQTFLPSLQETVILLRKELTFHGQIKQSETALDLTRIVARVRPILEAAYTISINNHTSDEMISMYGKKVFKCSRLSCRYFYDGFVTAQERDQHRDRHERPYRCTVLGCVYYTMGFEKIEIAKKHVQETHNLSEDDAAAFPDMKEVVEGWNQKPKTPGKRPSEPTGSSNTDKPAKAPKQKPPKITEWSCPHCQKVFKKKFNYDSHLITHSNRRDFACDKCGRAFARKNDLEKHARIHEARQYVCGGISPDGSSWGCGSKFARLDTLQEHHRSITGKACLASQQLVEKVGGT